LCFFFKNDDYFGVFNFIRQSEYRILEKMGIFINPLFFNLSHNLNDLEKNGIWTWCSQADLGILTRGQNQICFLMKHKWGFKRRSIV